MNEAKFWSLIDAARLSTADNEDAQQDMLDALQESLEDLEDADIAAFHQLMQAKYWQAFTYDLSGAIYVILDGECDADDFHGFRGWLISQGQAFFEKAVANADSLADDVIVPTDVYLPDILTIAAETYRESTGELVPEDANFVEPEDPTGKPLVLEQLPERLPRLCREFVFRLDAGEDDEDAAELEEAEEVDS